MREKQTHLTRVYLVSMLLIAPGCDSSSDQGENEGSCAGVDTWRESEQRCGPEEYFFMHSPEAWGLRLVKYSSGLVNLIFDLDVVQDQFDRYPLVVANLDSPDFLTHETAFVRPDESERVDRRTYTDDVYLVPNPEMFQRYRYHTLGTVEGYVTDLDHRVGKSIVIESTVVGADSHRGWKQSVACPYTSDVDVPSIEALSLVADKEEAVYVVGTTGCPQGTSHEWGARQTPDPGLLMKVTRDGVAWQASLQGFQPYRVGGEKRRRQQLLALGANNELILVENALDESGPAGLVMASFDRSNGSLQWKQGYTAAGAIEVRDIAVDASNNIVVVGGYGTTFFPKDGAPFGGAMDAVVLKFDSQGTLLWSHFFGTSVLDKATAVDANAKGDVFVTWNSEITDTPMNSFVNTFGRVRMLSAEGEAINHLALNSWIRERFDDESWIEHATDVEVDGDHLLITGTSHPDDPGLLVGKSHSYVLRISQTATTENPDPVNFERCQGAICAGW